MKQLIATIAVITLTGCGVAEHLSNECNGDLDGLCDNLFGEDTRDQNRQGPPGTDGSDGQNGAPGQDGSNGEDGSDGSDALAPLNQLKVKANRDYDPSVFNPTDFSVTAGVYKLPTDLTLLQGVSGTGWVTLRLGGEQYCYQGDGKNNNDPGTKFTLNHVGTVGSECFTTASSGSTELDMLMLLEDTNGTLSVNGGGVSSAIRTLTEVEAVIDNRTFN